MVFFYSINFNYPEMQSAGEAQHLILITIKQSP